MPRTNYGVLAQLTFQVQAGAPAAAAALSLRRAEVTSDGFDNRGLSESLIVWGNASLTAPVLDPIQSGFVASSFQLIFSAQVGVNYAVESSADLRTWASRGTVRAVSTNASFVDASGVDAHAFYRVRIIP